MSGSPGVTTTTDLHTADALHLEEDAQNLLFRHARTANTFTGEPVTDEQIAAIFELVKWAPTSMNAQPLRVVVVRSPEAKERLLPHLSEGNRAKTAAAPATALLAADLDFHEELPRTFPHAPRARDTFAGDEELRARTAELNTGLQAGYAILGIRAAGLAAGPMTGFDADGLSREFFPDGRHRILVAVNMGKPAADAWQERLPRLTFDEVVTSL
ncbi:malonic semialdehyde reductase [Georgenia sp. 10Sc9-8]|uniref:Malonic semialdehyde reductase n=1 Tax=Georgenia halotolerans TaxID=3028317 RepID=A0ABT5TWU4_9MICO|nr:malonic semialdehyde reductase [Georgenia halotolerans]